MWKIIVNEKFGYLLCALIAGFLVGICPVAAFVLGYNYEKAKEGKADLNLACLYIGLGLVGQIINLIIL